MEDADLYNILRAFRLVAIYELLEDRPGLLEAWLALTRVKYHENL